MVRWRDCWLNVDKVMHFDLSDACAGPDLILKTILAICIFHLINLKSLNALDLAVSSNIYTKEWVVMADKF